MKELRDDIWGIIASSQFRFFAYRPAICTRKDYCIYTNKTILLSLVCYGCLIWSFILKEEHRLRGV
jgi:hypothetical protein